MKRRYFSDLSMNSVLPAVCLLIFLAGMFATPFPCAYASKEMDSVKSDAKGQGEVSPEGQGSGRMVYRYFSESSRGQGTEKMISDISRKAAGKVYYNLKDEQSQAAKVAVVAAVPLSDLKRETEFGRLMAEYLLTDLADRGIKVAELRLGKEISIMAQTGEFILTRNIGELAEVSPELDYVLVSTFSNTRKQLIIQGRLVDLKDGFIVASWRDTLPLNRELLALFHEAPEPHTIMIKGMDQ